MTRSHCKIEFLTKNGKLEYDLKPYIIEEKTTIPRNVEEKLYTSSVTVDTLMAEDLTAMYPMTIASVDEICENEVLACIGLRVYRVCLPLILLKMWRMWNWVENTR